MIRRKIITIAILFISAYVFAGVNLKNGNFYISYTDLEMKSFRSAYKSISRTYNSKATEIGLFGFGWGSELETRLNAYPDGSITIIEYGSGGKTSYKSLLITDDMLELMIDDLIEVSLSQGDLNNSPQDIIARRSKLLNNSSYRIALWDKYVKKGLLEHVTDFPIEMEWESHQRGNSKLVRSENGYTRTTGRVIEEFDVNGNLVKLDEGDGVYTILEYSDNRLSKMISADGKEVIFTLNENGYVVKITSDLGSASYVYDGKKLIQSEDAVTNIFKYTYDDRYNMTSISYIDGSVYTIEYQPKTSFVKKITDRLGETTEYDYHKFYREDGSIDDLHYATSVIKENYYGEKATNYYEYIIGIKTSGERYQKMIKTKINGIETTTFYDELCNSPTEITRGDDKTTFKYNNRCLLTEKLSKYGDSIYMKYHPKLEKLIYVKNYNGVTEFEYDKKSNLIKANKDDGTLLKLAYNSSGQITYMNQNGEILLFEYNNYGKPTKITKKGNGSIKVTYDDSGEIENVTSDDGHEIALQVTQAFQNMLALIKPAGVDLGI